MKNVLTKSAPGYVLICFVLFFNQSLMIIKSRVVPPLGDPLCKRPPPYTDKLSIPRYISTLNYLRSADTCLTRTRTVICWLSTPAIMDNVNEYRVFSGNFNPKSFALKCPFCYLVTARVNACRMKYVISASQPLRWLCLFPK